MLPMRKPAFTDEPELTPLSERLARVQFDENGEAEIIVDREGMDEILSALKTVRGIEGQPRVIDEDHAYGDQEIYYGVLIETNFVEGEQSVVTLVACVSEESAYLSDNHGDLRDIDEFNFVVGPFKR